MMTFTCNEKDRELLLGFWCQWCGSMLLPVEPYCVMCGFNAARAARYAIQCGTRLRYFGAASRVRAHDILGVTLMFNLVLRLRRSGQPIKDAGAIAVRRAMTDEAAFCLDAPTRMPAGSCYACADEIEPDEPYPAQTVVLRDGETEY